MVLEQNKTYVGKLRVRTAAKDSLFLQLRLKQALASLDLHPIGLPSSATVFIRKLHDPAPGSLRLQDACGVPPTWAQAVAASLGQIVRRAARPALEHVEADVDAVLFADRAELIACLAADWCRGTAVTRWWWQSLFRATDVSSAVVREWLTSIECVPAAFAKLAQRQLAVSFAIALPAPAVRRLLDELARHFGLTELSEALLASTNAMPAPVTRAPILDQKPQGMQPVMLSPSEVMQLRVRVAPEAFAPLLESNVRVLLAAALLLERAPTLLRQRSFASRFLPMLALHTPEVSTELEVAEQSQPTVGQPPDLREAHAQRVTSPVSASPLSKGATRDTESLSIAETQRFDYRVRHDEFNPCLEDVTDAPKHSGTEGISQSGESSLATAEHRTPVATPIAEAKVTDAAVELGIETKLGGIFYLINAALALRLYGDFTTPLDPGIELSLWDFLALIGRKLAGQRIERDPIWPVLAKLASRGKGEQPGARFKPPRQLRMPPEWLKAFPEREDWIYEMSGARLVVMHPAGFSVLNLKLNSQFRTANLESRLASETRRYSYVGGFKRSRLAPVQVIGRERTLARWTRWIADYLRARLARSLGTGPADDLTPVVFARTARVQVTPARLDVFFSLAELPVAIRLAGLDRDPGWVPVAGRAIAFHYD